MRLAILHGIMMDRWNSLEFEINHLTSLLPITSYIYMTRQYGNIKSLDRDVHTAAIPHLWRSEPAPTIDLHICYGIWYLAPVECFAMGGRPNIRRVLNASVITSAQWSQWLQQSWWKEVTVVSHGTYQPPPPPRKVHHKFDDFTTAIRFLQALLIAHSGWPQRLQIKELLNGLALPLKTKVWPWVNWYGYNLTLNHRHYMISDWCKTRKPVLK